MRKAKPLRLSIEDYRSDRLNISPANLVVFGHAKLIAEPLLLEALANHPGIGNIWYVPITYKTGEVGNHNFTQWYEEEDRYMKETETNSDLSQKPYMERLQSYASGPAPAAELEAFNITPLLKRHDGQALTHEMVTETLFNHFKSNQPETITTSQINLLINNTNYVDLGAFITRRENLVFIENDPILSRVLNEKLSIPRIGKHTKYALHLQREVTTDCTCVDSLKELRDFMDSIDADQVALKTSAGIGGRGVFRIFRETKDGPLIAECTSARKAGFEYGAGDDGQPQLFCLTDNFFEKEEVLLAMRWLDNDKGDIRVVIQDGKAVGAYKRMHGTNNWLCNHAQGGSIHPVDMKRDLSLEDRLKIKTIGRLLKDNHIGRASIDLLADTDGKRWLSEINIGCTDDIVELNAHHGEKLSAFGRLSVAEQMAADIMARYADIRLEEALFFGHRSSRAA